MCFNTCLHLVLSITLKDANTFILTFSRSSAPSGVRTLNCKARYNLSNFLIAVPSASGINNLRLREIGNLCDPIKIVVKGTQL